MPQKIVLMVDEIRVIAELRDTPTAEAIIKTLPTSGETQRWGGELYFPVSVSVPLEADSRESLLPGELGYWPQGNMFCIFFGATPASEGDEIRPASAVNVFGRLIGRWSPIKQVPAGKTIRVELLSDSATAEASEPAMPMPQEKAVTDSMYSPTSVAGEATKEPQVRAEPEEPTKTYTPTPMPESALFEPKPEDLVRASAAESEAVEETAEPASTSEEVVDMTEAAAETHEEISTTPAEKISMIKSILSNKKTVLGILEGAVILILIILVGMQLGRAGNKTLKQDLDQLRKDVDAQKKTLEDLSKTVTGLQTTTNKTVKSILDQVNQALTTQLTPMKQQLAGMQKQISDGGQGAVWVKNPANNHSYCISPVPLPWHQARDAAKKMGGYLASLTDAKENEWMVATFGEQTEFWIGLTDEQENRKWVWASGEKFEFANWAPGEPDNYRKNQHYVVINSIVPDKNQVEPGRWKDVSCNEIHLAIIERDI